MATASDSVNVSGGIWEVMRTLFRQHRRRFLIAAGELDLHPAQAGALMQLDEPMPMHALAAELGCDNSNVTGLVDRLAARDLVTRQPSQDDRRVRHVVLTASGRRMRAQLLEALRPPDSHLERLSDDERRQLLQLLSKVVADA
jgi:MarR family transcriptional regulator, organic hydroperoxide resistance regulator